MIICSQDSTATAQTKPSQTHTTQSMIKTTATPTKGDVPRFPIYIGHGEKGDDEFRLAFVMDRTVTPWCSYQIRKDSKDPCGPPFTLLDGFEYHWDGCGKDSRAFWRNPSENGTEWHTLLSRSCEFKLQRFQCVGVIVSAEYLCGNSTN